ncbi:MAG: hypothetical protein WD151_15945 [Phycisphaeraceae bacterium]
MKQKHTLMAATLALLLPLTAGTTAGQTSDEARVTVKVGVVEVAEIMLAYRGAAAQQAPTSNASPPWRIRAHNNSRAHVWFNGNITTNQQVTLQIDSTTLQNDWSAGLTAGSVASGEEPQPAPALASIQVNETRDFLLTITTRQVPSGGADLRSFDFSMTGSGVGVAVEGVSPQGAIGTVTLTINPSS